MTITGEFEVVKGGLTAERQRMAISLGGCRGKEERERGLASTCCTPLFVSNPLLLTFILSPFAAKERKLGRVRVDDGWWIRWLVETGWYRRMLVTVDVWWLRLMAETGLFQRMTTIADECRLRRLVETRIYWRFSTETGEC